MDIETLRAFSAEIQKQAAILPTDPKKKLLIAGTAIGTLGAYFGGKRAIEDIRMGERMRRGGGY